MAGKSSTRNRLPQWIKNIIHRSPWTMIFYILRGKIENKKKERRNTPVLFYTPVLLQKYILNICEINCMIFIGVKNKKKS